MTDIKYVVYGLHDPRTNELRYIGKTTYGVYRRMRNHYRSARIGRNTHVAHWLASLEREGLAPTVRILDTCLFPELLNDIERQWIANARKRGARLTNLTDGGEGALGRRQSEEAKARISAAAKGNTRCVGRQVSEATRARMSAAQRAQYATPAGLERRQRLAEMHRGMKAGPETRARMSAAHLGNQNTLGYRPTKETREKLRQRRLGWKHSEETKRRIAAGLARFHNKRETA
jgi:hypothetical protein